MAKSTGDRTLRPHGVRRKEELAAEDPLNDIADLPLVLAQFVGQRLKQLWRRFRLVAHKLAIQLANDEPRRLRLLQNPIDRLAVLEGAGFAQHGLRAGIVLKSVKAELSPT